MVLFVWKHVRFDLNASWLIDETYSASNWCLFCSSLLVISAGEKKCQNFHFTGNSNILTYGLFQTSDEKKKF